jgi:hypothetical protein
MDIRTLSKTKYDIPLEICAPLFGHQLLFALTKLGYKANNYETFNHSLDTIFKKAKIKKRHELFKNWDFMSNEEFRTSINRLYSKTETYLSYFILYLSAYIKELQTCIYKQKYLSMESFYKLSIYSARSLEFFNQYLKSIQCTKGSDKTHTKQRTTKDDVKQIIHNNNLIPNSQALTNEHILELLKQIQSTYKLQHKKNLKLSETTLEKWLIEWYPHFGLPKKNKLYN